MFKFILLIVSLVITGNEAFAARYISDISMSSAAAEGLYLEPAGNLKNNALVKEETKMMLEDLADMNQGLRKYKEELLQTCFARNVRTGEKIHFSSLTDEEFIIWEKMRNPKAEAKKYSPEYIATRKRYLDQQEAFLNLEIERFEKLKTYKYGEGIDARAQDVNIKAHQLEHGIDTGAIRDANSHDPVARAFRRAQDGIRHRDSVGRVVPHGTRAGVLGAAVVGASIGYQVLTGSAAQAQDLKLEEFSAKGELDKEERAEPAIGSFEEKN